jgi:hypothetical protein
MATKKAAVSVKASVFNIGGEKVKAFQFTDYTQFIADVKRARIKESLFAQGAGSAITSAGEVMANDWFVYLDSSSYFVLSNKWFKKLAKVWEDQVDEEAPSEHSDEKSDSAPAAIPVEAAAKVEADVGTSVQVEEQAEETPAHPETEAGSEFEIKKIIYADQIVAAFTDPKMKKSERVELANRLIEKMTDEQKASIRAAVNQKLGYRAMYTPPAAASTKESGPWADAARRKDSQQRRQHAPKKSSSKEAVAVVKRLPIR